MHLAERLHRASTIEGLCSTHLYTTEGFLLFVSKYFCRCPKAGLLAQSLAGAYLLL